MSQPKPENQIDYIELPMREAESTKRFYSAVFGWKFEDYGTAYTSFVDGRISGGFTKERTPPGSGILLVIYCGNLSATAEKVKAAGGTIVKEVFSFPGGYRFHFTDPNGNELAVWSEEA